MREREDDIIWKVPFRDDWVYVYLLIEFQSTVDQYMALRLLTYIGLLYQDLLKTKQIPSGAKLPPVFPVVLYNGRKPWDAPLRIEDLIQEVKGGLSKYRPLFQYLIVDEHAYQDTELPAYNLVSAIFRL